MHLWLFTDKISNFNFNIPIISDMILCHSYSFGKIIIGLEQGCPTYSLLNILIKPIAYSKFLDIFSNLYRSVFPK